MKITGRVSHKAQPHSFWIGKQFADAGNWDSAVTDSVRGLRTDQYVIDNPQSAVRYLSTDNGTTTVVLLPCQ